MTLDLLILYLVDVQLVMTRLVFQVNEIEAIFLIYSSVSEGGRCDDNDPCTTDDICTNLVCTGSPKCTAGACEIAYCNTSGNCYVEPLANCSFVTTEVGTTTAEPGVDVAKGIGKAADVVGIVVGVVVGFVVLVAGAAAVLYYLKRKEIMSKKGEEMELVATT